MGTFEREGSAQASFKNLVAAAGISWQDRRMQVHTQSELLLVKKNMLWYVSEVQEQYRRQAQPFDQKSVPSSLFLTPSVIKKKYHNYVYQCDTQPNFEMQYTRSF